MALGLALGLTSGWAAGQPSAKVARLGYLSAATSGNRYLAPIQERLRELGWAEGENVISEYRDAAGRLDRLPDLARDLATRKVDVIVAMDTSAAHAAKAAVIGIPVVFAASDPRQLVGNLARPGGHLTGVTNIGTDIAGKQLELLKQMVPTAARAAALARTDSPATGAFVQEVQAASRSLGLRLDVLTVADPAGIDQALRGLTRRPVDILLVQADWLFFRQMRQIIDFTATHRLPALYGARDFPRAGGLVSYGTNLTALYGQLGEYVDRILRGARPGDLPVAQPTTFELVINAATAKALGLTIPEALRIRADGIIE